MPCKNLSTSGTHKGRLPPNFSGIRACLRAAKSGHVSKHEERAQSCVMGPSIPRDRGGDSPALMFGRTENKGQAQTKECVRGRLGFGRLGRFQPLAHPPPMRLMRAHCGVDTLALRWDGRVGAS